MRSTKRLILKVRAKRVFFICLIYLATFGCQKYDKPSQSLEVAAKGIHSSAISPNGEFVLVGSVIHGASLWDITDKARLFNWNHKPNEQSIVTCASFSGDQKLAVTANPFELALWRTANGEGIRYWSAPGEILDVKLDQLGNVALLGLSDHSAVLFDIQRGGIKRTLKHNNRVRSVDISANGRWALTGSEDYNARLWDLSSGKVTQTIKHNDDVQLVKLSRDGRIALSVSKYDKALLWKTTSGEPIGEIPLHAQKLKRGLQFTSAAFNHDASQLLTGRPDEIVQLWDVQQLKLIKQWKLPKRDAWKPTGASVTSVRFVNDTTFLAVASNGFIHTLSYVEN